MRANDKPFPCEDCRFNIDDNCRRNPPTALWIGGELSAFYPSVRHMSGCFAGEPRIERSCVNCINQATIACRLYDMWQLSSPAGATNWHCCEWEGEE
jgi:hypothetical protein